MSSRRLQEPPGAVVPYIIPYYAGESMIMTGTKSSIRILASAKETERLISVFFLSGGLSDPVTFHYHNESHDIFLPTKGEVKVWAGDQCRILGPGDFCSVPPKIVHAPQLMGPVSENLGIVTPGDWVDFFRFVSERTDNEVIANEFDERDFMALNFSKLNDIKEKHDVIFQPEHQGAKTFEWTERDSKIPGGSEAYYLKANTGPRYLLEGVLSRPFITTKQTNGKFAMTSIESSRKLGTKVLPRGFSFDETHQIYYVLEGTLLVTIDGKVNQVRGGETVFIPAKTKIGLDFEDNLVRFWSISSGDGLETLISQAGRAYEGFLPPNKAEVIDVSSVSSVAKSLSMSITLE